MRPEEVTQQILEAWDEVEGATNPNAEPEEEVSAETATPEPDEEEAGEEEQEGGAEGEPDEDEELGEEGAEPETEDEEEVTAEEGGEEGQGEPPEATDYDDPEIRAFLAKFQGDVEKALRYGLQSQQSLSRQGQEKAVLARRVQELEAQLQEAQVFSGSSTILSEEQRQWVEGAVESGQPAAYVREAMRAGEYGLARAVCAEWGREQPYEALRVSQMVDATEAQLLQAQQEPEFEPVNHELLMDALVEHYPEIDQYRGQMRETLLQLGENHPVVQQALSNDIPTAMAGVFSIYEIARASTQALSSTRERVRNGNREAATTARKKAVVASAGATPSAGETPRTVKIGPGLTLEDLEREWEANT